MSKLESRKTSSKPEHLYGNKQGERGTTIGISIKPRMRELLNAAADDCFRSMSGQAAHYIVEGLRRDGYISNSDVEKSDPVVSKSK